MHDMAIPRNNILIMDNGINKRMGVVIDWWFYCYSIIRNFPSFIKRFKKWINTQVFFTLIIKRYFILICFLSSLMSLVWCFVLTEMLIDLLDLYIIIFKLNNTYIGLTVLGIGTSMPDAITTIALAK